MENESGCITLRQCLSVSHVGASKEQASARWERTAEVTKHLQGRKCALLSAGHRAVPERALGLQGETEPPPRV